MIWKSCVRGGGDSEAVYQVRLVGRSRSFVESHTRDRPKQPHEQFLATRGELLDWKIWFYKLFPRSVGQMGTRMRIIV